MSSSFLTSIKPLIVICQLTGFFLFQINTKIWRAEVKKLNILSSFVSITVCIACHYIYWSSYFGFDAHGTKIPKNIMPKLLYSNLIFYSLVKICLFWKRQKFAKLLWFIHQIDENFKELDVKFDYEEDRKMILKVCGGTFALIVVSSLIGLSVQLGYMINIDPTLSILNFCGFFYGSIIVFQNLTAMIGIRRRFVAFNKFLIQKINLDVKNLKILADIHLMLVDSIETFNSVYGLTIMLFITVGFGWFCLFIFMTLMVSIVMWTDFLFVSFYSIFVNLMFFSLVTSFFYYAEYAKKEEKKITKVLYKILCKNKCEDVKSGIRNLITQTCDLKAEFSCGLIDFNWKFFFKVRI